MRTLCGIHDHGDASSDSCFVVIIFTDTFIIYKRADIVHFKIVKVRLLDHQHWESYALSQPSALVVIDVIRSSGLYIFVTAALLAIVDVLEEVEAARVEEEEAEVDFEEEEESEVEVALELVLVEDVLLLALTTFC